MLFSSVPFLFYFLPTVLLVYFLVPKRAKNGVLLLSSLVFYGWGEPRYLPVMLVSILQGYIFGRLIERFRDTRRAKLFLVLSVLLSLGTLAYFKYADFMIANLNALTGLSAPLLRLALPVGISFYTFQILSYTVDVYRGTVPAQRNFIDLAAYIAMFPQLIAGPIVRYSDVEKEIEARKSTPKGCFYGMTRFCVGLAKKVLIADYAGAVADQLLGGSFTASTTLGLWFGVLMYMFQIYFDFSGYSDMAIGMGRIFGFKYPENFRYPYVSKTITEFWRRWHISLSSFFRDYVYIPLGGNRHLVYRNMAVVWLLTGLWHGASWNFIFWGLYFFLFIYMENTFLLEKFSRLPRFVSHLYAMVVVYFGWVLFRCESLGNLGAILKGMFGLNHNGFIDLSTSVLFQNNLYLLIFCIIASTPLLKNIGTYIKRLDLVHYRIPYLTYAYEIVIPPVLLILSLLALVGNSYNPFLYFQF